MYYVEGYYCFPTFEFLPCCLCSSVVGESLRRNACGLSVLCVCV